jgi:hypothetical protein
LIELPFSVGRNRCGSGRCLFSSVRKRKPMCAAERCEQSRMPIAEWSLLMNAFEIAFGFYQERNHPVGIF